MRASLPALFKMALIIEGRGGFFSLLSFQKVMGEDTCSLKISSDKIKISPLFAEE